MPNVTRDDILLLVDKTSAEYGDWLQGGLADFLFGSRSRKAFPGAESVIGGPEHIDDELAAIGEALLPHERHRFIAGLWQAISFLDWAREDDARIVRVLLSVADKLEARNALGPIMAAALEHASTNATPPATRALFERIVELADEFASANRPETADEMVRLRGALGATFPTGKVRHALMAMCRARPESAPYYIKIFLPDLDRIFGGADDGADVERLRQIREAFILQLEAAVTNDEVLIDVFRESTNLLNADPNWLIRCFRESRHPKIAALRDRLEQLDAKRFQQKQETEEVPTGDAADAELVDMFTSLAA